MDSNYLQWLRDVAQGASNAAAGNVSGPVDLIAAGLRKVGVPVGSAPVGGSEWMRSKGFTQPPRNPLLGLVGETLGLSAPIAAAAKAPQIANALNRVAENAAVKPTFRSAQRGGVNLGGAVTEPELAQRIADEIAKIRDPHIGLRVLPPEQAEAAVGDALPHSYRWADGDMTDELLNGASTVGLGEGTLEDIAKALRLAGVFRNGPNGYYYGPKLAIVGGKGMEYGEDVGEAVLHQPTVRALFDNPRWQK
jgi:hypothetical protein